MSKAVLISIKPKWCELIANGMKTIEVRKTRPKIDTPFKCYIYCAKGKAFWLFDERFETEEKGNGKVIGEFVCDEIIPIRSKYTGSWGDDCLSDDERKRYLGGERGWAWHISGLVIYDKPRELDELCKPCINDCLSCKYYSISYDPYEPSYCDWEWYMESTESIIKRPPQSWCYVEDT